MKKILMILFILIIGFAAYVYLFNKDLIKYFVVTRSVACTTDAKLCPDGSAVGRIGPKCEFAECPITNNKVNTDITLGVGEKVQTEGLSITLNSLVQDSRCPIDVQCIQAGAVNTNVTLTDSTHTVTKNFPSDGVPETFGDYKISIINIAPPRMSGREVAQNEYKITFHIEK